MTYCSVGTLDRRRRIGLFPTKRGWCGALGSVKSRKEGKMAYVLVRNDVRL